MTEKTIAVLLIEQLGNETVDVLTMAGRGRDYAQFAGVGREYGYSVVVGFLKNLQGQILHDALVCVDGEWKNFGAVKTDQIFDRSVSDDQSTPLKQAINRITPILNHPTLNYICWDKAGYSKELPGLTPKTFVVSSQNQLLGRLDEIETNRYVLKPRFGILGYGVQILTKQSPLPTKIDSDTLVQEYVDTDRGVPQLGVQGRHEFRVVMLRNKIQHCYLKVAGAAKTTNVYLGADAIHIRNEQIPKPVSDLAAAVAEKFKGFERSIYAVDCGMVDDKHAVLIEVESMPRLRMTNAEMKNVMALLSGIFGIFDELG